MTELPRGTFQMLKATQRMLLSAADAKKGQAKTGKTVCIRVASLKAMFATCAASELQTLAGC